MIMPDFKGPGQWRSQAAKAQGTEPDKKPMTPRKGAAKKPTPKPDSKK